MKSLNELFLVFLLLAFGFQLEARSDETQCLYQVVLESDEGIIELSDTPEPPRIFFLLFGNHSFEPGSLILERKEQGFILPFRSIMSMDFQSDTKCKNRV